MKFGVGFRALAVSAALVYGMASAVAATVYEGSVSGSNEFGYVFFTYDGGNISINTLAYGWTGGPTGNGIDDIMVHLFQDNGSPIGALTGRHMMVSDDSQDEGGNADGSISFVDSYFRNLSLDSGKYLLAIGRFNVSEQAARVDGYSEVRPGYYDYKLTFSADVAITQIDRTPVPMPVPGSIAGTGIPALAALGAFALWRQRRKAAPIAA